MPVAFRSDGPRRIGDFSCVGLHSQGRAAQRQFATVERILPRTRANHAAYLKYL
jgi:hypothetical protein